MGAQVMTDKTSRTQRRTIALAEMLGWARGIRDALGGDRAIGLDTNTTAELDEWLAELREASDET
jgi:hypothetical protein